MIKPWKNERLADLQIVASADASLDWPPNSAATIDAAFRMGADIVHVDVRRTEDGAFVCFSSDRLESACNLSGAVARTKFSDLMKARLLAHPAKGTSFVTGAKIVALERALVLARGRGAISVEIDRPRDALALARFVAAFDPNISVVVKAQIVDPGQVLQLMTLVGDAATIVPIVSTRHSRWLPAVIHDLRPLALDHIEVRCDCFEELRDAGIMGRVTGMGVWLDTRHFPAFDPSNIEIWDQIRHCGVTTIQTNWLAQIAAYRDREKRAA